MAPVTRRDFGKAAGLAGLGAAVPALLTGCSSDDSPRTARAAAAQAAATRSWRVTGTALAGLGSFDATMKSFMQARNVPSGQLAVVRKGKLVLSRGYTWSSSTGFTTQP